MTTTHAPPKRLWRCLLWLSIGGFGGDFWRLMMLCCALDEAWWLETLLHDDLETWHLTWSISWVGSQEACLLVLTWELTMTRMDDVASWDDDQTDGYAVAVTVPYFVLLASWVLHTLRVGFLKPLLVGSKRTQVGFCKKSWSSYFSWNWKDLRILKSSTSPQAYCIWWFLSIYHWVFHSHLVSLFYVIDLLLWCISD